MISKSNVKCIKPWSSLFIKDSELRVCCWSKLALARLDAQTSIADFWNNDVARFVRQKMLKGNTADICPKTCPILKSESDSLSCFEKHKSGFSKNERKIYEHLRKLEVKLGSKPFDVAVVIDHLCNLRCKMCFVFRNPAENLNYIVPGGFYKIINQIHSSLRSLFLIGGEPFYSQRTLDFIEDCLNKDYKFKFGFITNLTIFKRELLSRIAIAGFCVSIDGATKETYEKIRIGAKWDKVVKNLKALIRFEKESKEHFVIKVAFLVMTSNFREIPLAIDFFEPLGVALEFPPVIQIPGDPENIFERKEYYIEFMQVIRRSRKKTSQMMVLNSLSILEQILKKGNRKT